MIIPELLRLNEGKFWINLFLSPCFAGEHIIIIDLLMLQNQNV